MYMCSISNLVFSVIYVQRTVRPRCGRLVGFESGDYHGVLPITKGQRCAVAMWYTFNQQFQETSHQLARVSLENMADKSNMAAENKIADENKMATDDSNPGY